MVSRRLFIAAATLLPSLPGSGHAEPAVYPGCALPAASPGHHVFYVDPAKGQADGDGSAAHPWQSLAAVLDPRRGPIAPSSPGTSGQAAAAIEPGDTILLMSGHHGRVTLTDAVNSDFITVKAASGQTPVIDQLTLRNAAKWVFEGITFQGQDPSAPPAVVNHRDWLSLVSLGHGEKQLTSHDIILTHDSFSTAEDTSGWSADDWLLRPYYYAVDTTSPCVSISDSRFYNLLNGIAVSGIKSLVQHNTIDAFANDGIDMAASAVTLRGNTIRDGVSSRANPWHPDGIQGWSKITDGVPATNTDVLVADNTIIKTGDPAVSFMQGISIFDGRWDGLTIENNVVVTNHWHGIAVFGAKHLRILNNTVVASDPVKHPTWIRVDPAKDKTPSQDVVVRNNVSQTLMIHDNDVTLDHNAVGQPYSIMRAGTPVGIKQSDRQDGNMIYAPLAAQFVSAQPGTKSYDLHPKPRSPLIGAGSRDGAPATDLAGVRRAPDVTIGAYQR